MKKPKISIIIPVYNVEKYLRRCLDSVLNQTFSDWEAICVNDGSPDNSDKILAEFAKKDTRFKILNKKNGGLSDARNVGLEKSSGKYVLYLDSDDFLHPQTLEILNFYAAENDAEMVVFDLDVSGNREMDKALKLGHDISGFIPTTYNKRYNVKKFAHCITDRILFHATEKNHTLGFFRVRHCYPVLKMLARNLAIKHKFIKDIIIEDFPWWSSVLLDRPHTVIVQAPLYFYTPNEKSILHASKSVRIATSVLVGLESVYNLYKTKAKPDEFEYFSRNFLWPFIIIVGRKFGDLTDKRDKTKVRSELLKLYKLGVFDNPPTRRARKYRRRIENFISQI